MACLRIHVSCCVSSRYRQALEFAVGHSANDRWTSPGRDRGTQRATTVVSYADPHRRSRWTRPLRRLWRRRPADCHGPRPRRLAPQLAEHRPAICRCRLPDPRPRPPRLRTDPACRQVVFDPCQPGAVAPVHRGSRRRQQPGDGQLHGWTHHASRSKCQSQDRTRVRVDRTRATGGFSGRDPARVVAKDRHSQCSHLSDPPTCVACTRTRRQNSNSKRPGNS